MEIERRFLLSKTPENLSTYEGFLMKQGYIVSTKEYSLRVREVCPLDMLKPIVRTLTYKFGKGLSREEFETEVTDDQFLILWKATDGVISKIRYKIPLSDTLTAEFDVFANSDLAGHLQVEVEFPDEESAKAFEPPEWFGREVTEDGRYTNAALAEFGIPK